MSISCSCTCSCCSGKIVQAFANDIKSLIYLRPGNEQWRSQAYNVAMRRVCEQTIVSKCQAQFPGRIIVWVIYYNSIEQSLSSHDGDIEMLHCFNRLPEMLALLSCVSSHALILQHLKRSYCHIAGKGIATIS